MGKGKEEEFDVTDRLRDVVTVGDCREKPLSCHIGACEDSSEKILLPVPHPKSSCVPLGVTAPVAVLKCL